MKPLSTKPQEQSTEQIYLRSLEPSQIHIKTINTVKRTVLIIERLNGQPLLSITKSENPTKKNSSHLKEVQWKRFSQRN
jgi:hypothetical protein